MKDRLLEECRVALSMFLATMVLFAYLFLVRAYGVLAPQRVLIVIFKYGISAHLAATWALRSALVWLFAFTSLWLGLSTAADRELPKALWCRQAVER